MRRWNALSVLALLLLAGCVTTSPWEIKPDIVTLHFLDNAEFNAEFENLSGKSHILGGRKVLGFAVKRQGKRCRIYLRTSAVTLYVLRHEARHCREKIGENFHAAPS